MGHLVVRVDRNQNVGHVGLQEKSVNIMIKPQLLSDCYQLLFCLMIHYKYITVPIPLRKPINYLSNACFRKEDPHI